MKTKNVKAKNVDVQNIIGIKNLNFLSIIGIGKSKILAHYRTDWLYA